jgi:DNA-binding winged helix-turn-helix (wHTH) protein
VLFWFEDFVLDSGRRELRRGGELLAMEPQVFDLLVFLVGNRDRVVSKDNLLEGVWGGRIVSDSTVASRINALRRAVGDSGEQQRLIRTIIGKGIRFVGDVHEAHIPLQTGAGSIAGEPGANAFAFPDKPSVVALPFANLSGDPDQYYFADGMVEEIITALSRYPFLFVIARNSSFAYKTRQTDVTQIGREVNRAPAGRQSQRDARMTRMQL